MMKASDAATELVCAGCRRPIEACAFCDQEGCPAPACYTCVVVDLHQVLKQPHEHGG